MGQQNIPASARVAVVGRLDPGSIAAGTTLTGWVAAADWGRFLAVIQAGTLGASATLDAKLRQATDNAGTGAKDIPGKAITQMTQAGGDSNKQSEINLHRDELDFNNGFNFVALSATVAVAASDMSALLLGLDQRYNDAADNDAASVKEIIA
jgi:hypothetical protein